jgi:VanZ family protein
MPPTRRLDPTQPRSRASSGLRTHLLVYWLPLALYVGLVFLLSSLSRPPFRLPPVRHLDKLAHFLEYSGLAFLLARALWAARPRTRFSHLVLATLGLVALLAGLDELYQSTVPRRDADAWDFLADVLGGCLGVLAYGSLAEKRRR